MWMTSSGCNFRAMRFAAPITTQSRLGESFMNCLTPCSKSAPVTVRSGPAPIASNRARVNKPPLEMACRIAKWFSLESIHRAWDPPCDDSNLIDTGFLVEVSNLYRMGTEFGTWILVTLSSSTWSKYAMRLRIVFACATTIIVRLSGGIGKSSSSNNDGAIVSYQQSNTRCWQS